MTGSAADELRVAVVGSGPSGFYTTEALLRSGAVVTVDMFERLPVPYGLVRFGVAPDHPKLKQVTTAFDRIAAMPGFRFVGGIAVGDDVTIDELREAYDAVVLATGAELSRTLDISGEALPGSHSAGDFVAWYNGHPQFADLRFDLDHETAIVIGHGNVALDVARILAKTADELRQTDITRRALDVLAESRIREIHVIGRSGPAQAKFTAKELRDFLELGACDTFVDMRNLTSDEFEPQRVDDPELTEKLALLRAFSQQTTTKPRRCVFRFGLSPAAIRGRSRLEMISFKHGSGAVEDIACGLAFRSVGRKTAPMAGVPYDLHRGVHANIDGRVAADRSVIEGLYVCGWSKRGPNGTIGTNRGCGVATAEAVLADIAHRRPRSETPDALLARLTGRVARIVSYPDWGTIDAAEKRRGAALGKPREKFVTIPDMLAAMGA
ncbi:FAD-dependent oxidoreductase [Bradyrhizobium sp. CCBAU 11361]|uniref:FAD-dependent oxidoreductase n=1 Tax=Bradyrhizobium sp. CCBAU 11361 TaxID=1630812 RepID=UPI0023033A67|nr:FAD-dependent oxidoreductase [Bradyrhizobium sp. CCBAU 11361]MDA9490236.1 pyridine nucleotide-disulfide oxidoreductase [Bradyrhizobium sp. CCBAU 11361]